VNKKRLDEITAARAARASAPAQDNNGMEA